MRKQTAISLLFIFIFTLAACKLDPNDQFIQGTWEIAKTDADNEFFEWNFNNGTFIRQQEIDRSNSMYTTGRYRVFESDGDLLTLELFDYKGDRISYENNPMTVKIEIDRENNTVRITNVLFVRVVP